MIQSHFDDTHLCIKCSRTIVGLDNYIAHRKQNCQISAPSSRNVLQIDGPTNKTPEEVEEEEVPRKIARSGGGPPGVMISTPRSNALDHSSYGAFEFAEPDHDTSAGQHGGKATKSLAESYDLPYDLCADAFFSSLQLQSVQTGGKTGSTTHAGRDKSDQHGDAGVSWIESAPAETATTHPSTDNLMQAVHDLSGTKKPYEGMFQPIAFDHDSPDVSEDDEEDDDDEEIAPEEIDDDDDEYEVNLPHASGTKWKFALQSHSPPVVPVTHTGGKWKPEYRPSIHTQLTRLSPTWGDEPADEPDAVPSTHHPPASHTKGKWIPGSKVQRLEYKADLLARPQQVYWCNICCRKLKSRAIYEHHLKTSYHLKRAEPEMQLERADLNRSILSEVVSVDDLRASVQLSERRQTALGKRKRHRRRTFVKCELCKLVVVRHVIGKHLISHYHYRRMQMNVGNLNYALGMILENIHPIVLQSPFQCRPCRYYFNTEEAFMQHWQSAGHRQCCAGPGKLWCSYCSYECEDNAEMLGHLLGDDHREVVMAINRSVPICISKRVVIVCPQCGCNFRYNMQLREHMQMYHPDCGDQYGGTASASYQCNHKCRVCGENLRSKIALQRHEKNAHYMSTYFCSVCGLEFGTPCQARRHRKSQEHRLKAAVKGVDGAVKKRQPKADCDDALECDKCDFRAPSDFEAMLHNIEHQEETESSATPKSTRPVTKSPKKKLCQSAAIKCKDCPALCENRDELKLHRDTEHPLLRHLCMQCAQSFATPQALGRHSRVCQLAAATTQPSNDAQSTRKDDKWCCDQCNFESCFESELIYHGFFHTHRNLTKRTKLSCPFCGKTCGRDSLRCHLRLHTNEKIFECEICKFKFSRRHNLKDHINKFHRPTATETTTTTTTTTVTDVRHETATSSNERSGDFLCLTCGKVFPTHASLAAHCVAHDEHGERTFACTHEGCHYVGLSGGHLQKHMATHSGTAEAHKCPLDGCSYVGRTAINLRKHTKSQHSAVSAVYECDYCNFTVRSKTHLERHLRMHTGEKPFACPYCDVRCNTFDNVRKHILKTQRHPGRFIYECKLCEAVGFGDGFTVFKSNSHAEYQKHLKGQHKQ